MLVITGWNSRIAAELRGLLAEVVDQLNFVARIRRARGHRLLRIERHCANADAGVALGGEAIFEMEM